MPIDDQTRAKLAQALGMLEAERAEDRAAVASAVAAFIKRSGLDWDELLTARARAGPTEPATHPDTEWAPAEPIDGNPGSWRWYRGYPMTVRRCREDATRPGWQQRTGRWYALVGNAMLVDRHGRTFFPNENAARAAAEAFEECPEGWPSGVEAAVI
ncbi:MAG TPA: hypothetical protein VGM07_08530 [Stellaceae bacterium]|jgi:hypothetical protein